jgi:hypothetical protein
LAAASGQRRAQVVAYRCQQPGPHPVGLGYGPGRLDRRGEPLLLDRSSRGDHGNQEGEYVGGHAQPTRGG